MSFPRLILALLTLFFASRAVAAEDLPVLRTVQEVRALSNEEAARGYPVHVQGVITFSEKNWGLHFVADATGGIYLQLPGERTPRGKLVEIRGRSRPGLTVPYIDTTDDSSSSLVVRGEAPMPEPLKPNPDQLHDLAYDAQLVQVRGKVQRVSFKTNRAVIELSVGGYPVHLQHVGVSSRSTLPSYLQDFTVTATGVLGPRPISGEPQMLYLGSFQDVEVDPEELEQRFASAQPASETAANPTNADPARLQRASGQIVYVEPGIGFFLSQARSGPWKRSVWVYSPQVEDFQVGQHMEAVGKLDSPNYEPVMRNAAVRPWPSTDDRPPVTDRPVKDPFEQGNAFNGKLITVDLPLLSRQQSVTGEETLILSRSDGLIFGRVKADPSHSWQPVLGSLLRVTGVCVVKEAEVFGVNPEAFRGQLLIRSPRDIEVLRAPPFWTGARLLWLVGGALAISLLALAWIVILRRQVRTQIGVIGRHLEQHAIHQERARVAREWHDTLQQQLIGVSIQVQAAEAQCHRAPTVAAQMLRRVKAMLRHSQAEARRSVWNLRNQILEQSGLVEALKELRQQPDGKATVEIRSSGISRRLPTEVEFHLLRIAQEAVANSLQHSGATVVELS
ncbi:MAG TPA: histidine kinase, partial [Chthoniobacteraceae bacterium]